MNFHDVQFPADLGWGYRGGPSFNTAVLITASGFEQRNVNWRFARCAYSVSHIMKSAAGAFELRAFFKARFGAQFGFRFKDWIDYQCTNTTGVLLPVPTVTSGGSSSSWTSAPGDVITVWRNTLNRVQFTCRGFPPGGFGAYLGRNITITGSPISDLNGNTYVIESAPSANWFWITAAGATSGPSPLAAASTCQLVIAAGSAGSAAASYQMFKLYNSPLDPTGVLGWWYIRPIFKPCDGTMPDATGYTPPIPQIWHGATLLTPGTDYTIDFTTGLVGFTSDPGAANNPFNGLHWAGDFDVPVRFGIPGTPGDQAQLELRMIDDIDWSSIQLVEIKMANTTVTAPTPPAFGLNDNLTVSTISLSADNVDVATTASVTATITLSDVAPTGGSIVRVSSSDVAIALVHVPSSSPSNDQPFVDFTVPAGSSTFTATIIVVGHGLSGVGLGNVAISANHNGTQASVPLIVYAPSAPWTSVPGAIGSMSRHSNEVTVTFNGGYYPAGGWSLYIGRTIVVTGAPDTSFNGTYTIDGAPADNWLRYANTGADTLSLPAASTAQVSMT